MRYSPLNSIDVSNVAIVGGGDQHVEAMLDRPADRRLIEPQAVRLTTSMRQPPAGRSAV